MKIADKTILNLLTIIIAGVSLFSVFTQFNSPELNASFLGENPFMVKKNIIERSMFWVFAILALTSLLLQAYKEIIGNKLKERLYSTKFYTFFFIVGIIIMVLITFILVKTGNKLTRFKWVPVIIESQKGVFARSYDIIKNNGWRNDQLPLKDKLDNSEHCIKTNWGTVDSDFSQIEKLLEIKTEQSISLQKRMEILNKYFNL